MRGVGLRVQDVWGRAQVLPRLQVRPGHGSMLRFEGNVGTGFVICAGEGHGLGKSA